MKVKRERNVYLRRIFTQQPHTYSYDMTKGKYSLINKEGTEFEVNPNGILKQQFRPNFSGCVNHIAREKNSLKEPSALHYTPDHRPATKFRSIIPKKFAGYAQYPYQIAEQPSYLKHSNIEALFDQSKKPPRIKQRSLTQRTQENLFQKSEIISEALNRQEESFFKRAYGSISQARPSPNNKKKACYSDKCRYLKQITLQSLISQRERQASHYMQKQTLGISFHEDSLKKQLQQTKRLAKLGLSTLKKR